MVSEDDHDHDVVEIEGVVADAFVVVDVDEVALVEVVLLLFPATAAATAAASDFFC